MSRNYAVFDFILTVLAVVIITPMELSAQGLPPSASGGSANFLPVPTSPVVPAGAPNMENPIDIRYPETNTRATNEVLIRGGYTQGIAQPDMAASGTPSQPIQPRVLEPERPVYFEEAWTWQFLPDGILYKSYLAGGREPRFAAQWVSERDAGWLWDVSLGARAGIIRYGTINSPWPEGWQVDIEGAAFPRLNLEHDRDLDTVDFRFGIPITVQRGPWQAKLGYYHYSSHLGDEFMVRNNTLDRINYVRESVVLGVGLFLNPNLRLYSEAGYGFYVDGQSKPWEFQFGVDYSPIEPTYEWPAPFFAVNGRIREEVDYGGNVTVQTGYQWRGQTGRLMRIGMQYFNGMSDMAQFLFDHEEEIGLGMWYDF